VQGGTDYCDEQGAVLGRNFSVRWVVINDAWWKRKGISAKRVSVKTVCAVCWHTAGWIVWAHAGNEGCAVNEKGGLDG